MSDSDLQVYLSDVDISNSNMLTLHPLISSEHQEESHCKVLLPNAHLHGL